MHLETLEILAKQHLHLSSDLLKSAQTSIELASDGEERARAEERYDQLLHLHGLVEERHRRLWPEDCNTPNPRSGDDPFHLPSPPAERIGRNEFPMKMKLASNLPNDAAHLCHARHAARTFLQQAKMDDEEMDSLLLIVGELCANVVRHARLDDDDCYRLEVELLPLEVFITVTDPGRGFERDRVPMPDGFGEGGRGLWMIENLAHQVDYLPAAGGGTSVRASYKLRSSAQG